MISIKGLDKAEVFRRLYNAAQPQGMGFLHYDPKDMTIEEAREYISNPYDGYYFDYVKGRVMKVDLNRDEFDPWLYDRDNGNGDAYKALEGLL